MARGRDTQPGPAVNWASPDTVMRVLMHLLPGEWLQHLPTVAAVPSHIREHGDDKLCSK